MCNTHREPKHASSFGELSTEPESTRYEGTSSKVSSSKAMTRRPSESSTGEPFGSLHGSPCERHRRSPNNPLKSARTVALRTIFRHLTYPSSPGWSRVRNSTALAMQQRAAPSPVQRKVRPCVAIYPMNPDQNLRRTCDRCDTRILRLSLVELASELPGRASGDQRRDTPNRASRSLRHGQRW